MRSSTACPFAEAETSIPGLAPALPLLSGRLAGAGAVAGPVVRAAAAVLLRQAPPGAAIVCCLELKEGPALDGEEMPVPCLPAQSLGQNGAGWATTGLDRSIVVPAGGRGLISWAERPGKTAGTSQVIAPGASAGLHHALNFVQVDAPDVPGQLECTATGDPLGSCSAARGRGWRVAAAPAPQGPTRAAVCRCTSQVL
jgi:hypothetical protein